MITYFIQRGLDGPVKIGITRNLHNRLRVLATGSAEQLHVLGYLDGDHESALHQRLAAHRLQGEWFSPAPEVLESVPANCGQTPLVRASRARKPSKMGMVKTQDRRRRGTGTIEPMPDGTFRPRLPGAGGRLRACATREAATALLDAAMSELASGRWVAP